MISRSRCNEYTRSYRGTVGLSVVLCAKCRPIAKGK